MRAVILVTIAALAAPLLAAEEPARIDRLEFTAVEQRRVSEEVLLPVAQLGFGWPEMDALNDYVDWINRTWTGNVDDIDDYLGFGVGVERRFGEDWYGGVIWHHLEADTDGTLMVMGTPHDYGIDLRADGAEIYARREWPGALGPLDVEALAGVGLYHSRYEEAEEGFRTIGRDEDVGLRVGVGASGEVARNVDLSLRAGYLYLEFDDYRSGGDRARFFSPGNPGAEAEFTGWWASLGLTWRF